MLSSFYVWHQVDLSAGWNRICKKALIKLSLLPGLGGGRLKQQQEGHISSQLHKQAGSHKYKYTHNYKYTYNHKYIYNYIYGRGDISVFRWRSCQWSLKLYQYQPVIGLHLSCHLQGTQIRRKHNHKYTHNRNTRANTKLIQISRKLVIAGFHKMPPEFLCPLQGRLQEMQVLYIISLYFCHFPFRSLEMQYFCKLWT